MDDYSEVFDDGALETAELDTDDLSVAKTPRMCPGCD
jgi:hypothetical protein